MTAMRKSDGLTLPAITRRSDFFSIADVELEREPVSGHPVGANQVSQPTGSNAAVAAFGDAKAMRFERPVSGVDLPLLRVGFDSVTGWISNE